MTEKNFEETKIPVIVIVGPTGGGKTSLAIEIARQNNGEVISADSMQIYRGMDIGTAKATIEERKITPHHLIDVADPDEYFSAADFTLQADKAIENIVSRGKLPIVAGGTGFYIDALIDRYEFPPQDTQDMPVRQELEKMPIEWLRKELKTIDSLSAARLHENDRHRIVRAIEVYRLSGRPLSTFNHKANSEKSQYLPMFYGVGCDRESLHKRLGKRVEKQMEDGLFEEVLRLHNKGYSHDSTAMLGIAYRQLLGVIRGEYSLDEGIEMIVRDSRRYARRQYTWFNKNKRIKWLDINSLEDIKPIAEKILIDYNYITRKIGE